jgi:hypothetical protein
VGVSFAHDERVFAAQVTNDRGRLVLGTTVDVPPWACGQTRGYAIGRTDRISRYPPRLQVSATARVRLNKSEVYRQ